MAAEDIVTIVICIVLLITLILPKKLRYAVHSLFLFFLGGLPILYSLGVVGFTYTNAPIIKYVITFVIVLAGRSLITEAINMESEFKWVAILMGLSLVVLTTIPSLHEAGALSFGLPEYPAIVDQVLYLLAGGFLIAGIFFIEE